MEWRSFNGDVIKQPLLEKVEEIIQREKDLGYKLKVCVGTDSRVCVEKIEFATVVVFLREGKGGFMLVALTEDYRKMGLNQRMMTEVSKSVEVAYSMCELLDIYQIPLEVHADINTDPNFKSNVALREATGYILSMGFIFKAKPEAFASTYCADHLIH